MMVAVVVRLVVIVLVVMVLLLLMQFAVVVVVLLQVVDHHGARAPITTVHRRHGQIEPADSLHDELVARDATAAAGRIQVRGRAGTALGRIVQHADRTVLPNPVRHLVRVDPDR